MNSVSTFEIANVHDKLATLQSSCDAARALTSRVEIASTKRDCEIRDFWKMPPKIGLGKIEGQARLLHDLANIELQATELALRSLCEFPDAPEELRDELHTLALDEGRHLRLCLEGLDELGFRWGHWPIHMNLWTSVSQDDTLLDRLVVVHRYLEGAGLDAGVGVLSRLNGTGAKTITDVVGTIVREEVGHVAFGSKWYHQLCREQGIDIETDFRARIERVVKLNPRKENLDYELRKKAGFNDDELRAIVELREKYWSYKSLQPNYGR